MNDELDSVHEQVLHQGRSIDVIGIYSTTRQILDTYRLRHLYGVEQAHEALKRWLRKPGNQPQELLMAEHFSEAEPVLRGTLEIVL